MTKPARPRADGAGERRSRPRRRSGQRGSGHAAPFARPARRRSALGDDPAARDDRDAVGEVLRLVHVVRREQDRLAERAEAVDERPRLAARGGVEARRRLVEEEQLGSPARARARSSRRCWPPEASGRARRGCCQPDELAARRRPGSGAGYAALYSSIASPAVSSSPMALSCETIPIRSRRSGPPSRGRARGR